MTMSKQTAKAFAALELCGIMNMLARTLTGEIAAGQPAEEVPGE